MYFVDREEKIKNITKSGNVLESKVVHEGERGNDLVLTIDMELQQAVDKIIEEHILETKTKPSTDLLDRAFVVVMDPHSGKVSPYQVSNISLMKKKTNMSLPILL